MAADATQLLASLDLFEGLSSRALQQVAKSSGSASYAAGDAVVQAGEAVAGFKAFSADGANLYIVVEGTADVVVNGDVVAALGPGDYFGELSLIDGGPRSASVVAGSNGLETLTLSKWSFDALLDKHPEVAVPMLRVMVSRLRRAESAADR